MPTIGVQMMMLKEQVAELGAYEVLRRLDSAGFGAVEVSQIPMTPANVAELRRAKDDLGTDFGAISAQINAAGANDSLVTDYRKVVADARALDCSRVRIGMMPVVAFSDHDALLDFCREAEQVAQQLASDGLTLYYHNHHVEFARRDGGTLLDLIREWAPSMRLELDVHWVQRGGKDPVRTLAKYAGVVDLVHLKDYRIGSLSPATVKALLAGDSTAFSREFFGLVEFAEVGEGSLEWVEIIEQAERSGAEYLFIEQDQQYGRDPFDCLATSRDNLRALGFASMLKR